MTVPVADGRAEVPVGLLGALEALCRRLTGSRRLSKAVQVGMVAVAAEPLRESAQRALIAAHLANGHVRADIDQYRGFARLLHTADDLRAIVRTWVEEVAGSAIWTP